MGYAIGMLGLTWMVSFFSGYIVADAYRDGVWFANRVVVFMLMLLGIAYCGLKLIVGQI